MEKVSFNLTDIQNNIDEKWTRCREGGMPGSRVLFGNDPSIGTIEINDGIAGAETVKLRVLSLDNKKIIETISFERKYRDICF